MSILFLETWITIENNDKSHKTYHIDDDDDDDDNGAFVCGCFSGEDADNDNHERQFYTRHLNLKSLSCTYFKSYSCLLVRLNNGRCWNFNCYLLLLFLWFLPSAASWESWR